MTGRPRVGMIWAQSKSGIIGRAGRIPWDVPEDMARFKKLTSGAVVIMGRKTWDSLPDRFRPLPERLNIVVTRQSDWVADGAESAPSVSAALARSAGSSVWVIGGGEIYKEALSSADVLEVTTVESEEDGDTTAPKFDLDDWTHEPGLWQMSLKRGTRYKFDSYVRRTDKAQR